MEDTIKLILYGISVILPSTITIITLNKKKYFNKGLQDINFKIEQNQQKAITRHQKLSKQVQFHNKTISKYLETQHAAQRIREITKHALQYCGNRQISKVLQNFTQGAIDFVQNILQIGFQQTNKQQIIAKYAISRQNSLNFLKNSNLLTDQQFCQWNTYTRQVGGKYIDEICKIYQDIVNNKNSRFLVKTQDTIQNTVRQFILFMAKIDSSTRINIYGK